MTTQSRGPRRPRRDEGDDSEGQALTVFMACSGNKKGPDGVQNYILINLTNS
jgi:hypothetical protein